MISSCVATAQRSPRAPTAAIALMKRSSPACALIRTRCSSVHVVVVGIAVVATDEAAAHRLSPPAAVTPAVAAEATAPATRAVARTAVGGGGLQR